MPLIPVDTEIEISFARTFDKAAWQMAGQRTLVVVPDASGWNDFNKNFRARLHFAGFAELHSPIEMKLMFASAVDASTAVDGILGKRAHAELELIEESFVSVLANTESYRIFVERLSFADAFASLRRMHDAVVTRLEGADQVTLALAQSMSFVQSVLREDATWDAMRQGDRYLTPGIVPDVADAAQSFNIEVQLQGMSGTHSLDADFGQDFPLSRRALVLVGENGVGKTRFFRALIDGVQTVPDWDVQSQQQPPTFSPRPEFSRLIVFSSAASDPYPSQVPPWRGVDYRFHRMIGHPGGVADDLAQSLLDCMRSEGDLTGLYGTDRMELLDAVLGPLGFKDDLYVEVAPIGQQADLLPVPIQVDDRHYLPFFGIRGEQRRLQLQARMVPNAPPRVLEAKQRTRDLSSGEQALLRFATQAIGSLRSGTLFLFDEPETHLHPRYVSILMTMLERLLELSGSIALIATHSAYVVREVPARRVRIMRKDPEGGIIIEPPGMQTFGASIDTISQFVFGDVELKHRFHKVLDSWLTETPNATLDQFRESFREDLNAETLSYIAQMFADRQPL
ncbi:MULTISPECIES: AAA family ATPase [unclassified Cryobacterium]|uniref:AAA family ATPase n=1 Tax=unclassified Cryobacterium TaxID=2649013 RepID=UPI00106AEF19|nr:MULTISPECIES: AAA family ATPase [unclassified Cryobacterium]TFC54572.1 hypothetical protein E3O68_09555 [Cryobacterium sp. TMB3-1-2]TFC70846.1 hypothetical protein E3T21_09075 [Cryobacterium sp. TMB3-15]TFC77299.1 hypothetical protein E3T22_06195 [Cryobacterium sp. TMB3-10]TFD45233.1 hypothetical protein E3T58_02820 [Cryobacterium sp. TMB3-12]